MGLKIHKYDELISLVNGYITMNDFNTFYEKNNTGYKNVKSNDLEFPHIAVNIGSGVSILNVESLSSIKRVTGTLMGGGKIK